MPKVAKKKIGSKLPVLSLETLNKPVAKIGRPKVLKSKLNWIGIITVILLTVIAVSSSYIAYELKNTSYRISTYKAE